MREKIYIGNIEYVSEAIGPGKRFGIWVKGCSLHCPNCTTPEYISSGKEEDALLIDDILSMISDSKNSYNIEGISVSGGEPFEQAEELSIIAKNIRSQGLTVHIWTGYTLKELSKSTKKGVHNLLAECDVLIDGRFDSSRKSKFPYKGSDNQKIYFLSGRYNPRDYESSKIEIKVINGQMRSIGVVDPMKIRQVLALMGLQ